MTKIKRYQVINGTWGNFEAGDFVRFVDVKDWHSLEVCENNFHKDGWHSKQDCPIKYSTQMLAKELGWRSPEDWQKAREQFLCISCRAFPTTNNQCSNILCNKAKEVFGK